MEGVELEEVDVRVGVEREREEPPDAEASRHLRDERNRGQVAVAV